MRLTKHLDGLCSFEHSPRTLPPSAIVEPYCPQGTSTPRGHGTENACVLSSIDNTNHVNINTNLNTNININPPRCRWLSRHRRFITARLDLEWVALVTYRSSFVTRVSFLLLFLLKDFVDASPTTRSLCFLLYSSAAADHFLFSIYPFHVCINRVNYCIDFSVSFLEDCDDARCL